MVALKENIVQVEFFHVGGGDAPLLDMVLEECASRIRENLPLALRGHEVRTGIKTVVRFFDETGRLTKAVLEAQSVRSRREKTSDDFVGSTGLQRWWLNFQSRRLAGKAIRLKKKLQVLVSRQLRNALGGWKAVAIERPDHSFRLVRKDEIHELTEYAANAKHFWLFVFRPNYLLSDVNTSVAWVM